MRLTNEQILTIKTIILRNFGSAAKLILFGSRLDDSKKGGDIDLLVETDLSPKEMFLKKIATLGQLQRALGEQKIDLLTVATDTNNVPDVVEIARKQGVSL
ncbi:MAG: nucleotidyltransferase domain-containing protein [Deltaproteobacteria bacterium]|nr:nucleotidyltransferase domain-containing protein [Candidatus Tharpella sp.]